MTAFRTVAGSRRRTLRRAGFLAFLVAWSVQGSALAVPGWVGPATAVPPVEDLNSFASAVDGGGKVHLAYTVGLPNVTLKYATNSSGSWVRRTVVYDPAIVNVVISIAVHAGHVYIAYARADPGISGIWVATDAGGSWAHTRLAAGPFWGPSIRFFAGRIRVAYNGNDGVHYRRFTGSGSVHSVVKAFPTHHQADTQLQVDGAGRPVVSFSANDGYVRVCQKPETTFICAKLDDGHGTSPSLAIDADDRIHVAWEHWASPALEVRGAGSPRAMADGVHYAHDGSGQFVRSLVKAGAHLSVLASRSLGIGPNQRPQIVYFTDTKLRHAKQTATGFAHTTLATEPGEASIVIHSDGKARVVFQSGGGLDFLRKT